MSGPRRPSPAAAPPPLSEAESRLRDEKRELLLRIEGLQRDRQRLEHILDGQRNLLKRINEEYREAMDKNEEQNTRLLELTEGLEESMARLEHSDRAMQEASRIRAEAEAELLRTRGELERRVAQRTSKLEQANRMLRELPARILRAQEQERKLVAHDLHDTIVQSIGALKLFIENEAARLQDRLPDEDFSCLRGLGLTAAAILDDLRRIMSDLRPPVIDDYGLAASLQWLTANHARQPSAARVETTLRFREDRVEDDLKMVVFRLTQEALCNLRKHSRAGTAQLHVWQRGNELRYRFEDDGRGFSPADLPPGGFGLSSMRERVELAGGRFSLKAAPGQGVRIEATLPLD
ncbi:MAG: ATP-binding protein [Desulfovibrionaceae bacterium]